MYIKIMGLKFTFAPIKIHSGLLQMAKIKNNSNIITNKRALLRDYISLANWGRK